MIPERRRFKRVPQAFQVAYRFAGELMDSWCFVNTTNIGAGGVRFQCTDLLEVGVLLEISLTVPSDPQPLMLKGRVIWSRMQTPGMSESGVEFLDVNPDQLSRLDRLVQFLKNA